MITEELKRSILNYAFCGKLSSSLISDKNVDIMYKEICEERLSQINEKKSKNDKYANLNDKFLYDIPSTWKWIRVGEIGNWGSGSTPQRGNKDYYLNGTISWLKTGELNDGYVSVGNEFITEKALKECSLKINKPGDILIAMYGATIGKLGIATKETTTNQACCGCTIYGNVYNKYLFYYLMSMRSKFISMGEGGAQPNISREKIINFPFPLAPYEEQIRIVDRLEILLENLENLKDIENSLNEIKTKFPNDLKYSVLESAIFGNLVKNNEKRNREFDKDSYDDIFDIPSNWNIMKIDDILDIQTGLSFKKNDQEVFIPNKKQIRVLRGGNINNNYEYELFEDDIYVEYTDKYIPLNKGDIITPSVTSMEQVGKCAYIDKNLDNITAGGFVYIIKIKDTVKVYPKFVLYYLSSKFHKKMCKPNIHKSGQAFYNLKKSGLVSQPIFIPPYEEQIEIANKLDTILPLLENIKKLNIGEY